MCEAVAPLRDRSQSAKGSFRMANAKQQLRDLLDRMPDDCSIEDIQYQLYVMETIQRRIDLAEKGETVSQAGAEKRLDKWITK